MSNTESVFVPEIEFREVPSAFDRDSAIGQQTLTHTYNGVIFDNLEEVERALRVFNWNDDAEADLLRQIGQEHGMLGVGLAMTAIDGLPKDRDLVGTVMAEMRCHLNCRGFYRRDFDYDAMGTNFMKRSVTVYLVDGDKFVLSISGSRDPDIQMAERWQKPMALANAIITLDVEPVDGWWYCLNTSTVLRKVISGDTVDWTTVAQKLDPTSVHSYQVPFFHDETEFALSIAMQYGYYPHVDRDGNRKQSPLVRRNGCRLIGPAWKPYREDDEPAMGTARTLTFVLSYPNDPTCWRVPIADESAKERLKDAARSLMKALTE